MYSTVGKIVTDHGSLPGSHFFTYLGDWYATTQASAVRRQADPSPRVISLTVLLTEIRDDPTRLSREWFLAHYDTLDRRYGEEEFDEHFAGKVGTHIDPEIVAADLHSLIESAERVREHVDKLVAHTDRRPPETPLTFDELNAAIEGMTHLFEKYTLLLTMSSWGTLVPVPQYDHLAIFREPWIKAGGNEGATRSAETS